MTGLDLDRAGVQARLDRPPAHERGLANLVDVARGRPRLVDTAEELLERAEIVLVVVQTPHVPGYGARRSGPPSGSGPAGAGTPGGLAAQQLSKLVDLAATVMLG